MNANCFNPQIMKGLMKKSPRKELVKKLDTVCSQYIRARDKRCVVCGSTEKLTNGHLFSRTSYSTRWDYTKDGNCHCQCAPCNYRHEFDPFPFTSWYIRKFGKAKWEKLHQRYRTVRKFKDFELQELFEIIERKFLDIEFKMRV
jgi:hypothetical protein